MQYALLACTKIQFASLQVPSTNIMQIDVVSMFKLRKPTSQPHRLPSKHCLHLCGNISTILVLNSLPKFPKNPHHIAIQRHFSLNFTVIIQFIQLNYHFKVLFLCIPHPHSHNFHDQKWCVHQRCNTWDEGITSLSPRIKEMARCIKTQLMW